MLYYKKSFLLFFVSFCLLCACEKNETHYPQQPAPGAKPDDNHTGGEEPEPENQVGLRLVLDLKATLKPEGERSARYEFAENTQAVALLRAKDKKTLIYQPLTMNRSAENHRVTEINDLYVELDGLKAEPGVKWELRLLAGGVWNSELKQLTFVAPSGIIPGKPQQVLTFDQPYVSDWQELQTDSDGQFVTAENGKTALSLQVGTPAVTVVHHIASCEAEADVEISLMRLESDALAWSGCYDLSDSEALLGTDDKKQLNWKVKPEYKSALEIRPAHPLTVRPGEAGKNDYFYTWAMPLETENRKVKVTAEGTVNNAKKDKFTALVLFDGNLPAPTGGLTEINSEIFIDHSPAIEGPLTLSTVDGKTSLTADNKDEIEFVVRQADTEVTAECTVFLRDGLFDREIKGNRFRTARKGTYEFYAVKDKEHSNHILVKATAETETDGDGHMINGTKFARNVTPTSGWYDVNKVGNGNTMTDGLLCWAAASSNILQWWLDDFKKKGHYLPASVPYGEGKQYRLAIFDTFFNCWVNDMHSTEPAVRWFMEGGGMKHTTSQSATPDKGGVVHNGGYFLNVLPANEQREWFASNYIEEFGAYSGWIKNFENLPLTMHQRFSRLFIRLIDEGVTALSIDSHELTAWGCDIADGLVTRIYITNSDDGSERLTSYKVEERNGDIHLKDYPGKTYQPTQIIRLTRMKAYPH